MASDPSAALRTGEWRAEFPKEEEVAKDSRITGEGRRKRWKVGRLNVRTLGKKKLAKTSPTLCQEQNRKGMGHPKSFFEIIACATRLGVKRIVFRPIGFDACLLPLTDGYEVQICSEHSKVRQSFSMAHEIGHLFFFEVTGKPKTARRERRIGVNERDREEEFLCDYAASELMMPSSHFFRDVRYFGPSIASLFELANRYQTSLRATAIKFAEMGLWKCSFVFWSPIRENRTVDFRVESCTRSIDFRLPVRQGMIISNWRHLVAALDSGLIVRGKELLGFGEIEEKLYIESVRIGSKSSPGVLSMIFADRDAQHLAYSSQQQFITNATQRRLFEQNE